MAAARKNPTIDVYGTGQRIRKIMEERGYTVSDVQEYLDLVTPQSIYHWFRGRNLPTIDNLYALSELFRVPIDEMVCGNRKERTAKQEKASSQIILVYYEKLKKMATDLGSGAQNVI